MSERVIPLNDAKRDAKRAARASRDRQDRNQDPARFDNPPVAPIGTADGKYWVFQANGELRGLPAKDLGSSPTLLALFDADVAWLSSRFPAFDREGNPTGWFSTKHVNAWLVSECARHGLFDPDVPQRGVGVWRAGSAMVLHTGRQVRHVAADGQVTERNAGFAAWGALWPRRAAVPPPGDPAPLEHAHWLLGLLQRWTWERSGEAGVFLGLWAAGLLGAAIRWRPHALVVGGAGTGKSSLMEIYALASPLAFASNDFTEPGLRQSLSGRAAPLVLDEAEGDMDGQFKMQKVIELLRRVSGGEGARTVKGSPGGAAQVFSVTSAAVLGAILPPPLLPQDASRITRLDLWPRAEDSDALGLPDEAERDLLATRAPGLWGRALAGLPRFHDNFVAIRTAILAHGCAPRLADQIGTILAARDMMLSDRPSDPRAAIDSIPWLIVTAAEAAADDGPHAALAHLLASPSEITHGGEKPSIGRLVHQALHDQVPIEARRQLGEHGLRVAPMLAGVPGSTVLYVANAHPRLTRIFEGTQWNSGRWRDDLRRLPGAMNPPNPERIGHSKVRCTAIPAALLPPLRPERED